MVGTCKETSEIATRIQKQAPQSEVEGVRKTYENVQAVEESVPILQTHRTGQAAEAIPGEPQPVLVPRQTPLPPCARAHTLAQ